MRHYLRLTSILSLAALVVIFCAYYFLDTNSYNAYCENEGGYRAYDPIGSFKIALIGFAILAFPCLVAKRPFSLKLYASISIDRKSTRLNSSHQIISYAVFCLKKKTIRPPTVPPVT